MNIFEDLFGGRGGSQSQGTATTAGAGDGGKKEVIDTWLGRITGAYSAVTGAGQKGGPAPSPGQAAPEKTNVVPYVIGAVVVAGLLWFLLKKK